MRDFIIKPAVQVAIVLTIGAIIITAFLTRQTSALGSVLTVLASTIGMFCYKAGWLHDAPEPPADPPSPPPVAVEVEVPSAPADSGGSL